MSRRITTTSELYAFFTDRGVVEDEKSGNGYCVQCPTHPDGDPSLWVSPKTSGTVALHCRGGCRDKPAIIAALGLTLADLSDLVVDGGPVGTSTKSTKLVGPKYLDQLTVYLAEAQAIYRNSPADEYVSDRFHIDADLAAEFGLGYDDGSGLGFGWVHGAYKSAARLVVPLKNIAGQPIGFQGRAVADHGKRNRWIGPTNPEGHYWATTGVFDLGASDAYWIVTEGPSDALVAAGVGVPSVCVRGAALSQNASTIRTLIEGLSDKRVVIAGDDDRSGQDFTHELGRALVEAGVQVHQLRYPNLAA